MHGQWLNLLVLQSLGTNWHGTRVTVVFHVNNITMVGEWGHHNAAFSDERAQLLVAHSY